MPWRGILTFVVFATILVAVLMAALILAGLGAGYCLHRLVPAIDLGLATVIGMLAVSPAIYVLLRAVRIVAEGGWVSSADEDEGEDDEPMSEEQVEYMADQLTEAVLTKLGRQHTRSNWARPSRQK